MFETLYSDPSALRRHQQGALAAERSAYLMQLASLETGVRMLRQRARYCLRIAEELSRWPPGKVFSRSEVGALVDSLLASAERLSEEPNGSTAAPAPDRRPTAGRLRCVALEFLESLGRLRPAAPRESGEHAAKVEEFLEAQREVQWQSECTCEAARATIRRWLDYLHARGVSLSAAAAADIAGFFESMSTRWSRRTRANAASTLRKWLAYGGRRGWFRPGLDATVVSPRLYRREGLPPGPDWEMVRRLLDSSVGDSPAAVRDRAILLLLTVYGVRSGAVRRLQLDDIDWAADRIVFERSKSRRRERWPLQPQVGEAIATYLARGRPRTRQRAVFLTLRAPHRPLTASAIHGIVARRYPAGEAPPRGRGPHGLRHAGARHLVALGYSFKEVGDHLGHRDPSSTATYAKVDLASLRQVALDDIGDLA